MENNKTLRGMYKISVDSASDLMGALGEEQLKGSSLEEIFSRLRDEINDEDPIYLKSIAYAAEKIGFDECTAVLGAIIGYKIIERQIEDNEL